MSSRVNRCNSVLNFADHPSPLSCDSDCFAEIQERVIVEQRASLDGACAFGRVKVLPCLPDEGTCCRQFTLVVDVFTDAAPDHCPGVGGIQHGVDTPPAIGSPHDMESEVEFTVLDEQRVTCTGCRKSHVVECVRFGSDCGADPRSRTKSEASFADRRRTSCRIRRRAVRRGLAGSGAIGMGPQSAHSTSQTLAPSAS